MKILGINHIGLAASDAAKARWFFKDVLQLPFEGEELVLAQKTNTVMFSSSHEAMPVGSRLEILENQEGEEGPIAKYIQTKGGGIHHLAISVDKIESAIQTMEKAGVQMIDKVPRAGAHNTRIAFVHPKATGGFLIEFVEQSQHG